MGDPVEADWLTLTRVLHVLEVVVWIGGVAFVTAVVLPALHMIDDAELRVGLFERLENRFTWIRAARHFLSASAVST